MAPHKHLPRRTFSLAAFTLFLPSFSGWDVRSNFGILAGWGRQHCADKCTPSGDIMNNQILLAVPVLAMLASLAAADMAEPDCMRVSSFVLPDVRIESTQHIAKPASHCKVAGIIGPEIRFELLLPDSWNGKFLMGGGGGFVGSVQNAALFMSDPLQRGYATVGTDTSAHEASTP